MEHRTTNVEISIDEDDQRTEARASVRIREREFHGWGRARRNPGDPNIPMIGEELAVARALSELSHELVGTAADAIEQFAGHPVSLHT